ncbi:hypothetical protein A2379_05220 [Candidatus Amesbacteria bacterium RIFOXYB1_FULL_47_13]|nr:MAG: hypothetical protein A2379_05220 [Candidatus Amesbacteria bacterium RIFOXYB1_FULL_47_13]HBC72506.1 hypothetical protein [Candidatus Amesbacteria bacterium]
MPKKLSLEFIAFLQALGLLIYCGFIGNLMIRANAWFSPPPNFLGPTLFLLLFIASAVICSLIFLGYPFLLFWEHKNTKKAIKLILITTAWTLFFFLWVIAAIIAFDIR